MSPEMPCPSPDTLRRSIDPVDPMTEAERQRIEAHVARCQRGCKQVIDALVRDGTLLLTPGGDGRGRVPETSADSKPHGAAALPSEAPSAQPVELPGYEILEEVGRGGMGVVYKARQVRLNRLAAVKMILAGGQAGPDAHARFQTEAEVVAALHHPNVVQIYEVGEHNGLPFLSLEFLEGGNLAQKTAGKPQPPRAAAEMVETLARAVHFAHGRGLVHRDLKPANVLLTSDGVPKITDFGLAKQLESDAGRTRTGEILGTPSYMAPEQAAPGPSGVGPPADVYALGAILYELLTGRPPFQGDTPWDVLLQVQSAEPAPPRRLAPKTPADLETICLKCLQKEPPRRYSSAEALADDLRRFLTDRTIQARPAGPGERLWRWGRRNPALAAAAGLAAAAALALIALSVAFGVHQGRAAADLRREQKQTKAAEDRAVGLVQSLQEEGRQKSLLARQSARLVLDQGQTRCEQGDIAVGMLSLAHGLEVAPDDAPELAAVLRINLDAWRGRLRPLRAVLDHPDMVAEYMPFSPDGKRLLTICHDGTVRLWDVATCQPVGILRVVHPGLVLAFSPDGKTIASAGYDKTVRLWSVETGEAIGRPMTTDGLADRLAFRSNGEILLTGGTDTVRLWSVKTGEAIGRAMTIDRDPMHHKGGVYDALFSPDGKTILTYSRDGTVRLWDAATQQERNGSPIWRGELVRAKFSPDGAKILTTSSQYGADNMARLWDADTGRPIGRPMPHLAFIGSTAFSPDSKLVLTGSDDRTAQLWDAATGEPLGPPLLHQGSVRGSSSVRTERRSSRDAPTTWSGSGTRWWATQVHGPCLTTPTFGPLPSGRTAARTRRERPSTSRRPAASTTAKDAGSCQRAKSR
jgi:WD40 repeat protein